MVQLAKGTLQATQGRLLTRGRGPDLATKQLDETKKTNELLKETNEHLADAPDEADAVTFVKVG